MPDLCLNTFAFSPFAGAPEPAEPQRLMDAVRAAGFGSLSLDVYTLDTWAQAGTSVEALATRLTAADLSCPEILGFVVGEDEQESLDGARKAADAVAALGASYVLGMVTLPPDSRCADLFARCAELVAAAGGRAAVEFLPFTPVSDIAAARRLVRHAGVANSGVLVDTWHFFHGADSWAELGELPVEEIAYLQVDDHPRQLSADADLYTECMTNRVMPGDGVFDLAAFRDALAAKGYDGVVSVEVLSPELVALGPEEFARRAHAGVRRFW